jgi:hypothetical protein
MPKIGWTNVTSSIAAIFDSLNPAHLRNAKQTFKSWLNLSDAPKPLSSLNPKAVQNQKASSLPLPEQVNKPKEARKPPFGINTEIRAKLLSAQTGTISDVIDFLDYIETQIDPDHRATTSNFRLVWT